MKNILLLLLIGAVGCGCVSVPTPISRSRRAALQSALEKTTRVELYNDERLALVLSNPDDIRSLAEAMNPRWKKRMCFSVDLSPVGMLFIAPNGVTNAASISREYIRFGGNWRSEVIGSKMQAIPPKPLLEMIDQHISKEVEEKTHNKRIHATNR